MDYLLTHALPRNADQTADEPAYRFLDQSLTHGEVEARTNQLARLLLDAGVRRGDRVGIYLHKCIERGYRIELDEIEAALVAHPDVVEAAVYLRPNGDEDVQIEAAIVARPSAKVDVDQLQKLAQQSLPVYAIPRQFRLLDSFPRTASGKVGRRRLQQAGQIE